MFKITRSTTVDTLKEVLNLNYKAVQSADKALADSIAYTAKAAKKDPKSVKKADYVELAKQVIEKLGDALVEPTAKPKLAVENSTKPKPLLKGGKEKDADNSKQDAQQTAEDKKSDKTTGADKPKTDNKPKAKPPTIETTTADSFPAEIDVDGIKYKLNHDIKDLGDVEKLLEEADRAVTFAFYWSKSQIKQFNYGSGLLPAPKEGFKDNLDLCDPLYITDGDEKNVCYALSKLTETLYQIMNTALEEIDGVRYSMGIEYQIYVSEPVK